MNNEEQFLQQFIITRLKTLYWNTFIFFFLKFYHFYAYFGQY